MPGLIPWLKKHGFLEQSATDPLGVGINTAATGWHTLALRLGHESPFRHSQRGVRSLPHLDAAYGLFRDVLGVRRADACRCACSSSGCLPSTTFFKALARRRYCHQSQDTFALFYGLGHWDAFQGELASELLRYLTFENLEMTHTCCAGDELPGTADDPLFGFGTLVLRPFGSNAEEIRDERGGLLGRLEALLSEFETRLREGEELLVDFVWGCWRRRMGEECVPVHDHEGAAAAADIGVRLDRDCELAPRSSSFPAVETVARIKKAHIPARSYAV